MGVRYIVQSYGINYIWVNICSFSTLEDAKKFIEKEKKNNPKIKYRILKQTTETIESEE